jgi:catechol 2,3-dioxygenase-like lactoylglutathione lyase family enzyme
MAPNLDHAALRVADLRASARLYEAMLTELGWERLPAREGADGRSVAFARNEDDDFALHEPIDEPGRDAPTTGVHLAFGAESREQVDAFHRAGLAHGGRDIGAPGVRAQYGGDREYYGAFVLDLGDNSVEAVWHGPRQG